jgi:predicted GNAT family acetyltransferase
MIRKKRWRRIKKNAAALEVFLKAGEPYCVAACSRILHNDASHTETWGFFNAGGAVEAILLCFHQSFFPVFRGNAAIPIPHFLRYHLLVNPLHALQGLVSDAVILENAVAGMGRIPREKRDYDLMQLTKEPPEKYFSAGPAALEIRRPEAEDADDVFKLQAAYEKEEVLPEGAELNLPGCRLSAEHIISRSHSFIAVLDGKTVGKINTGAASYNYRQIGGLYVLPEYRGRGIAQRLGAVFARSVLAGGKKITLFVKKKNTAAQKVYARLGFDSIGNYRINYY